MERLTKRNEHGKAYYPYCFKENTCDGIGTSEKCNDCNFDTKVCEKLAEYEDIEGMIYCAPFYENEEKFFELIEKALGFKLFVWQKTFILSGNFRRFGKTTAECLRELLKQTDRPIDYSKKPENAREAFHREETRRIQEKLNSAGIPTRTILWNEREKREYEFCYKKQLNHSGLLSKKDEKTL